MRGVRACKRYTGADTEQIRGMSAADMRMCAVHSARRICSNRVMFDLSRQRTHIPHEVRAVCESAWSIRAYLW